ncbi:MAG: riboflavin synthase [Lachnospiraceae bacterium]|nr:riboflavin synthase [Lachnospiraceae bacterium]
MFTGIIEEIGTVKAVTVGKLTGQIEIRAETILEGTRTSDTMAVNGVCLTVTRLTGNGFVADVMPETLRRSNLGALRPGDGVDLERAMAANGRFGGHIVSGHIDGTGTVVEQRHEGNAVWVRIQTSAEILRLIVEKGSIAIDGISLTVAAVGREDFQVSIIPHTGSETILLKKRPGSVVNLENDIIGKYVCRLMQPGAMAGTEANSLANTQGKSMEEFCQNNGGATNAEMSGTANTGSNNASRLTWEYLAEHGF